MKLNTILKLTALLAIACLQVAPAEAASELPCFQSKCALKAATATRDKAESNQSTTFYTGKPHEAELDAYLFKYRSYDSELNRWTSVDPSGFPDGSNAYRYVLTPNSFFDPNGLSQERLNFELNYGLGKYNGYLTYELEHGHESEALHASPGFSGIQSMGGSVTIGGTSFGWSTNFTFRSDDNSHMNYKGKWKQYQVEVEVAIDMTQVYALVTTKSPGVVDVTLVANGDWYE